MDGTRVLLILGVLSCVLLVTNLISVIVLLHRSNEAKPSQTAPQEEELTPLVNVYDYQEYAKRTLDRSAMLYMQLAATKEETLRDNEAAFSRYRLRPHMLRGVADANTTATILGHVVSCPIGISPTAMHRWATPEGENATARGAKAMNVIAAISANSNIKMDQVAAAAPGGVRWQQLYPFRDRQVTLHFVRRAEQSGYNGLVLTIDRPVPGYYYNPRKGLITLPDLPYPNFPDGSSATSTNSGQNWDELTWLRNQTSLPIVAKGIIRGEDAILALQAGADAIWVSNHGGRTLDGVPATIDVLSDVVAAVNGSAEVYMDGGIRTGTDVAKAIAMGARAVFVGRPIWYGLAHSGQEGVEKILDILQREFLNAMQLLGADRPYKLDSSVVIKPSSCVGQAC